MNAEEVSVWFGIVIHMGGGRGGGCIPPRQVRITGNSIPRTQSPTTYMSQTHFERIKRWRMHKSRRMN